MRKKIVIYFIFKTNTKTKNLIYFCLKLIIHSLSKDKLILFHIVYLYAIVTFIL